ncbi:serine/threonine-protein kinase [Paludisphaera soli]|uniref:serine/threonine-protein kinase n=1 Tax=Paludisphaera soli TaxID=2712865 RepID=UPI0013EC823E|nr:serine/threonine-protein kinase [Paludisphaera soli]
MTDGCPPPASLRGLAEAAVLQDADLVVAAHVERCDRCRDDLSRMLRETTDDAATHEADPQGEAVPLPRISGLVDFQEIGAGGAGVVYRARREGLDQWVAVKFPKAGSRSGGRRIVREARAAARVRHPNIVRMFEVGLAEGTPYIVMEYFEAGTLADRLGKGGVVAPEVAARLVVPLAEAAEAIHREGLVHRDFKPSNVLIHGPKGVALEACLPVVGDFGLAREISDEPTSDGLHVRGAPGYMAPEQIESPPEEVGEAADVFALGAILFRLVAGRPPFAGRSPLETVRLTLDAEAPAVGTVAPGVPRALEAVIAGCLRRRPKDRYDSAAALAEDLRRFLEGRPVAARRVSRRLSRPRTPFVAAIAAASLVATVAGDRARDVGAKRLDAAPAAPAAARRIEADATAAAEIRGRTEAAASMVLSVGQTPGDPPPWHFLQVADQARTILGASRPLTERGSTDARLQLARANLTYGLSLMENRLGRYDQVDMLSEEAKHAWGRSSNSASTTPRRAGRRPRSCSIEGPCCARLGGTTRACGLSPSTSTISRRSSTSLARSSRCSIPGS